MRRASAARLAAPLERAGDGDRRRASSGGGRHRAARAFFDDLRARGLDARPDARRFAITTAIRAATSSASLPARRVRPAPRGVVTTEKDLVRLLPFRPFPLPVGVGAADNGAGAAARVPPLARRRARRRPRPLSQTPLTEQPPSFRHRLEYLAVISVRGGRAPAADAASCWRSARCIGRAFYAVRRRAPAAGAAQPRRRRFRCAAGRGAPRRSRAAMFAHFGRLLTVLLKFSTLTPGRRCWRASSSRARSASRAAHAHGSGVLLFTGHFGFWEINALVHAAARCSRWRCWRGRSTTRCCTTCSSGAACRPATP